MGQRHSNERVQMTIENFGFSLMKVEYRPDDDVFVMIFRHGDYAIPIAVSQLYYDALMRGDVKAKDFQYLINRNIERAIQRYKSRQA